MEHRPEDEVSGDGYLRANRYYRIIDGKWVDVTDKLSAEEKAEIDRIQEAMSYKRVTDLGWSNDVKTHTKRTHTIEYPR